MKEWNDKLQSIIEYVECHLQSKEEPINNDDIAKLAGCSFDFFMKVFSYMNGMSFAEYVRSRKLTLAGYDIKSTNLKVIDISYKYGYASPTSFTKAFQKFHGISPKEAREHDADLNVVAKMQVSQQSKYAWRIEKKSSFRLIGKSIKISCIDNQQIVKIPELWNDCQKNGLYAKLVSLDQGQPRGMFGVMGSFDRETCLMDYFVMVENNDLLDEYEEVIIPEMTWAIFDCIGAIPHSIQTGWKYLNEEWLIKYPFKHAVCPEIEWYSDGNAYDNQYLSQIWIPIVEEES